MKMLCLPWVFLLLTMPARADAASGFRPGDWVSYSLFRYVNSIATDQRIVYFATTGGITRYNLFETEWETPLTTSDGLVDNRVNVVAVEPLFNDLWCATSGGVSRYHPNTQSWTSFKSGGGLFLDSVHSIGVTSNGRLLFQSAAGTAEFDVQRQLWLPESPGEISGQPIGVRWYGARRPLAYDYPLFIPEFDYFFDPPNLIQDRHFGSYRLTDFLQDSFANVWIGTWGLSAGRGSPRTLRLSMEPTGLVGRNVTAISADREGFWFGSGQDTKSAGRATRYIRGFERSDDGGGISHYDAGTETWTHYLPRLTDGLFSDEITSIHVDSASVWFGTDEGLVHFSKSSRSWTTLPVNSFTSPRVTRLAATDSLVWVGTDAGLNTVHTVSRVISPVLLPALRDRWIFDLAVDEFQDLWAATDNGVYRYRPGSGWKKIEYPGSGNLNRAIYSVAMTEGVIWFGNDTSILKFNRASGEWQEWLLPLTVSGSRYIMKVVESSMWLGTRYGAVRFDTTKETWQTYDANDGLLTDSIQAILADDDHIWFGTPEGVTRFYWNDPTRLNK